MVLICYVSYVVWVNFYLVKSFDVEVILVFVLENEMFIELIDCIEIQVQLFGGLCDLKVFGVIFNKVCGEVDVVNVEDGVVDFVWCFIEYLLLLCDDFCLIGCIFWQDEFNVVCICDIVDLFSVWVINVGDYEQCWVQKIVLCVCVVFNIV